MKKYNISDKKGFTLIELVLVIIIISVLAAVAVNITTQPVDERRFDATISEMNAIKTAMIGNPFLVSNDTRTDFGYMGDMGNLPSILDNLVEKGGQPDFNIDPVTGIGMGWNGPYLSRDFSEDTDGYKKDAWGTEYSYSQANGTITSAGSDRTFGSGSGYAQDITKTITPSEYLTDISGSIRDSSGNPITESSWVNITLYYPNQGTETSVVATPTSSGTFYFEDIPVGVHRIVAAPQVGNIGLNTTVTTALSGGTNTASIKLEGSLQGPLIYSQGSASVSGGSDNRVDFTLVNEDTVNSLSIENASISWKGGPNWGADEVVLLRLLRIPGGGSIFWRNTQEGNGADAASGQRLVLRNPLIISPGSNETLRMVFFNTEGNPVDMRRTNFDIIFELTNGPSRTISFASP